MTTLTPTRPPTQAAHQLCSILSNHQPPDRLVEQLTRREMEIMVLLLDPLADDGEGLAARLFITYSTLREHLQNAYAKLGANRRYDAIWKFVQHYPQYLDNLLGHFRQN